MKSATLPPVRVEPQLRADVESVLAPGESLAKFESSSVRGAVEWRRSQDEFLTRARSAVERGQREGRGLTPAQVLQAMAERLEAARAQLDQQLPRPPA